MPLSARHAGLVTMFPRAGHLGAPVAVRSTRTPCWAPAIQGLYESDAWPWMSGDEAARRFPQESASPPAALHLRFGGPTSASGPPECPVDSPGGLAACFRVFSCAVYGGFMDVLTQGREISPRVADWRGESNAGPVLVLVVTRGIMVAMGCLCLVVLLQPNFLTFLTRLQIGAMGGPNGLDRQEAMVVGSWAVTANHGLGPCTIILAVVALGLSRLRDPSWAAIAVAALVLGVVQALVLMGPSSAHF